MTGTTTFTAKNRAVLEAWARSMNAKVKQVAEDWQTITFEAETVDAKGTRVCCQFHQPIPRPVALRRLARTYVVGLVHEIDGAQCNHVRTVIPSGDTEVEARRSAILIASALVEIQRHHVCGATVTGLDPYIVERAVHWKT
ncbi:hypothetical protein [Nocardiopsis sp. FIRDI 009]|uniref:hypothetical protein n=1 Tax=Nocardiopsis sp. FIRDI 009 TaxID=714197 RepID=UPI0018E593F2|nr:hypothetical protein [Nocardiopsis sp. FIRDI 009]